MIDNSHQERTTVTGMKQQIRIQKLVLAAMFAALAYLLPFLTGQIPEIGAMLCPMHIPVLLCGFLCGWQWGAVVGFAVPLFRSLTLGMPPPFPTAFCMAFELACYGAVCGLLYRLLPRRKWTVYAALIGAMVAGRAVWGVLMFFCMGMSGGSFGIAAFLSGAVTGAIPGIIAQIVLVPVLVLLAEKLTARNSR